MVEDADLSTNRDVVEAFLAAAREGSFDALLAGAHSRSAPLASP